MQLDSIDGADAGAQSAAAAGKYFRWLAGTAAAAGVSVDVFAVGNSAANVAALAPVAERSGGLLVLQEGGWMGQLSPSGGAVMLGAGMQSATKPNLHRQRC